MRERDFAREIKRRNRRERKEEVEEERRIGKLKVKEKMAEE